MSGGTLLYTYAACRPVDAEALGAERGISGGALRVVRCGEIAAVVSAVPADRFGSEALAGALEDLGTLEELARGHDAVVHALVHRTAAIPFRMATVYLDEQRVREMLRERHDELLRAVDRVADHLEWGVKVHAPEQAADSPDTAAKPSSGRSYLQRRMAQRDQRDQWWQRASDTAAELDGALSPRAVDRRYHRPQSAALSGREGENVLNAAYLVATADTEVFLATAERFNGTGDCHVEVTGPWAPYSFALDPDAPAEDGR